MAITTHDIFLSYSRKDEVLVEKFRNAMVAGGYRIWIDRWRILTGDNWRGAVTSAIEEAQCLIMLVSANSLASSVVRKEVAHARRHGKAVYLIFLERVPLDGDLAFEYGDDHRELLLDHRTCCPPPNLIEALAEKHQLYTRAFYEQKKDETSGDRRLDARLDRLIKLIDRVDHQRQYRDQLLRDSDVIESDRPLVTLVHGPWNQQVVDFRETLSGYHLVKLAQEGYLRAAFSNADIKVILLGESGLARCRLEDFDNLVCNALTKRPGGRERVMSALGSDAGRCKVVVFRAHVPDAIHRRARLFLKSFFSYWESFPRVESVILLVKLEVTYDYPQAKFGRFLNRNAAALARRCQHCLLPGLSDVAAGDALGWVDAHDDVRDFLTNDMGFTPGQVRQIIHDTYDRARRLSMPMAELDPAVQARLKQARRAS